MRAWRDVGLAMRRRQLAELEPQRVVRVAVALRVEMQQVRVDGDVLLRVIDEAFGNLGPVHHPLVDLPPDDAVAAVGRIRRRHVTPPVRRVGGDVNRHRIVVGVDADRPCRAVVRVRLERVREERINAHMLLAVIGKRPRPRHRNIPHHKPAQANDDDTVTALTRSLRRPDIRHAAATTRTGAIPTIRRRHSFATVNTRAITADDDCSIRASTAKSARIREAKVSLVYIATTTTSRIRQVCARNVAQKAATTISGMIHAITTQPRNTTFAAGTAAPAAAIITRSAATIMSLRTSATQTSKRTINSRRSH